MKFLVTDIEFDCDEYGDGNPEWQLTDAEQEEIRDQHQIGRAHV